jgi:hypothetical protein
MSADSPPDPGVLERYETETVFYGERWWVPADALAAADAREKKLSDELAWIAEGVGAQTLDVAALGKGRKKILRQLVERLCVLSEGGTPPAPFRYSSTPEKVRDRFNLEGVDG